jgi:hypothetical protein
MATIASSHGNAVPKLTRDHRRPLTIPVPMLRHQPSPFRPLILIALFCLALYYYTSSTSRHPVIPSVSIFDESSDTDYSSQDGEAPPRIRRPHPPASPAFENPSLTESQCRSTFPNLTYEIDRTVANGPFRLEKRGIIGPLIAAIRESSLYILEEPGRGELSQDMKEVRTYNSPPNVSCHHPE